MKNSLSVFAAALLTLPLVLLSTPAAQAHCEIPCGIYGDSMRLDMIAEHITTLEKSMQQITALSKEGEKNYNQIVRWVSNKEDHANKIQEIVSQYFLTQRIKPAPKDDSAAYEKYTRQLALLHEMLIYAMKSKQTTDLENIEKLKALLEEFRAAYLGPDKPQEAQGSAHKHE